MIQNPVIMSLLASLNQNSELNLNQKYSVPTPSLDPVYPRQNYPLIPPYMPLHQYSNEHLLQLQRMSSLGPTGSFSDPRQDPFNFQRSERATTDSVSQMAFQSLQNMCFARDRIDPQFEMNGLRDLSNSRSSSDLRHLAVNRNLGTSHSHSVSKFEKRQK